MPSTPKYSPKPTAPAYQAGLALAAAAQAVVPCHEGAGLPGDLIGPTAAVGGGTGAQTVNPTWAADAVTGWEVCSFGTTSKRLAYAARGGFANLDYTLFALARIRTGDVNPVRFSASVPMRLIVSGSNILMGPGVGNALTATGAVNHMCLWTFGGVSGSLVIDFRCYDIEAGAYFEGTYTAAVLPAAGLMDFQINDLNGGSGGTFDLALAGMLQRYVNKGEFFRWVADPFGLVRLGSFGIAPLTMAPGTSKTFTLDGTATPSNVAARLQTDGTSLAVSDPSSLGNVPTVTGQSAGSETAGTVTISAPAGAVDGGDYLLSDSVGSRRFARKLRVTTNVAAATGYLMEFPGPSAGGVVNQAGPPILFTLDPPGGTAAGVTITPSRPNTTFSPTTVTLTTAAPSATVVPTATAAGSGNVTAVNDGGLANPAALAFPVAFAPLSGGAIQQGATVVTGLSAGRPIVSVTINSVADPRGGSGNLQTEWYSLPDPANHPNAGIAPVQPLEVSQSYRVAAQSGPTLVLTGLPYGRDLWLVRIVRDVGQGGTVIGFAVWHATNGPMFQGAAIPPIRVFVGIIGDSQLANATVSASKLVSAFGNGIVTYPDFVAFTANYALGATNSSQWQATSATVHPAAGNTGGLNYLKYAVADTLAQAAANTCDLAFLLASWGDGINIQGAGPAYPLIPANYPVLAGYYTAIAAYFIAQGGHAMFLGVPPGGLPGQSGGSVWNSQYLERAVVVQCQDLAIDYINIFPGDRRYQGDFAYRGSTQTGTTATGDGVHGTQSLLDPNLTMQVEAIKDVLLGGAMKRQATGGGGGTTVVRRARLTRGR